MKKKQMILCSMVMILALLLIGCGNKVKPSSSNVDRPVISGVSITEIKLTTANEYNETAGTVKAKTVSLVGSKVMGIITNVLVKEGDRVSAGQVLLTIDDRDLAPKVTVAESAYRESLQALEIAQQNQSLAGTTTQRYQQLYDENAISRQQMDQVETQGEVATLTFKRAEESVKQARANLADAQATYGFTQVTAPVDGVITGKKVDVGTMAAAGTTLFVLEDDSAYNLEADVDESIASKIFVGMTAEVVVDSLGKSIPGTVTEMAPTIDATARKLHIKIDVKDAGLKSGLYACVKIPTNKKETILVPKNAIVEKGQLTGLYVVDAQGLVLFRIVRMGKTYDGQVEILSGVNVGEKIITEGSQKVIDGGIVKEVSSS